MPRSKAKAATVDLPYSPYWKSGDDYMSLLERHKGNHAAALRTWSKRMRENAANMEKLAELVKETGATLSGGAGILEVWGVPTNRVKDFKAAGCGEYTT